MTILLEQYSLPERGQVKLHIQRAFEIKVSAEEARRKVDDWLFDHVSCMMGAESPMLVLGQHVVWRVPAILTAPHVGCVGQVGVVDVDVQTSEMNNTPQRIAELQQHGCRAYLPQRS